MIKQSGWAFSLFSLKNKTIWRILIHDLHSTAGMFRREDPSPEIHGDDIERWRYSVFVYQTSNRTEGGVSLCALSLSDSGWWSWSEFSQKSDHHWQNVCHLFWNQADMRDGHHLHKKGFLFLMMITRRKGCSARPGGPESMTWDDSTSSHDQCFHLVYSSSHPKFIQTNCFNCSLTRISWMFSECFLEPSHSPDLKSRTNS